MGEDLWKTFFVTHVGSCMAMYVSWLERAVFRKLALRKNVVRTLKCARCWLKRSYFNLWLVPVLGTSFAQPREEVQKTVFVPHTQNILVWSSSSRKSIESCRYANIMPRLGCALRLAEASCFFREPNGAYSFGLVSYSIFMCAQDHVLWWMTKHEKWVWHRSYPNRTWFMRPRIADLGWYFSLPSGQMIAKSICEMSFLPTGIRESENSLLDNYPK